MKMVIVVSIFLCLFFSGCGSPEYQNTRTKLSTYSGSVLDQDVDEDGYDFGHEWAEDNDVGNFDECQDQFYTSDAEDGCNDYVKENYSGYDTFHGYECTEDCSGHEAGYEWAENNDISDTYDCDGNSQSFIEGCEAYVEENY